jgi:hypothetical protein
MSPGRLMRPGFLFHCADRINSQPRGPKFKQDFRQAEVTKMIEAHGAPIDDADLAKIVDYLAATC